MSQTFVLIIWDCRWDEFDQADWSSVEDEYDSGETDDDDKKMQQIMGKPLNQLDLESLNWLIMALNAFQGVVQWHRRQA